MFFEYICRLDRFVLPLVKRIYVLYYSLLQSVSCAEYVDEESDPAMLRGREFVYKEIVSTEEDYIKDLKIILDVSHYTCVSYCITESTLLHVY